MLLAVTTCVFAGAAHDVSVEASKLEKKVEAALSAGAINKDTADKYTERLEHIKTAMESQGSTTSERRDMKSDMDKISTALTSGSTATFGDTPQ